MSIVPGRTTGHTAEGTYLQGLVVPTVCPVLAAASSMKELECPVGVTELQAPWGIQAHQADAALDHVQRVPVGGVCRAGKQSLCTALPRAWGPLCTAPHTTGRHTHRRLPYPSGFGREISQIVLSFCTNPRVQLTPSPCSSLALQLCPVLPPDVLSLVLPARLKGAGVGPSPWMLDS